MKGLGFKPSSSTSCTREDGKQQNVSKFRGSRAFP